MSAPAADPLRTRLQTTLGMAYTLERERGAAGMSRAFVAEETRFRRRVVLKVLARELAEGLSGERFPGEIRIRIRLAAALQERRSVPLLTADEQSGAPRLRRGAAANPGARPLAPAPRPAPRP